MSGSLNKSCLSRNDSNSKKVAELRVDFAWNEANSQFFGVLSQFLQPEHSENLQKKTKKKQQGFLFTKCVLQPSTHRTLVTLESLFSFLSDFVTFFDSAYL